MDRLQFAAPVTHVYNPLAYAWAAHEEYLNRYATTSKRVVFLGMNPGPFGMVQTGVPFGEIAAVRDWLKISSTINRPATEHPKRPIHGLDCKRSEVSGRRLWKLFLDRFVSPEKNSSPNILWPITARSPFCEISGPERHARTSSPKLNVIRRGCKVLR